MILLNICEYVVPHCGIWLLRTMQVCFWIYVGLSAVASAGLYLILWSTLYVPSLESQNLAFKSQAIPPNMYRVFPIHMMTPTWVFPAYPLLLTCPFAAHLIDSADVAGHPLSINKTAIALCATATQGTGCLIAFMISAAFIYRLMTQKLPRDMQRPGVVRDCPSHAEDLLSSMLTGDSSSLSGHLPSQPPESVRTCCRIHVRSSLSLCPN